jgi:hypothetical protein
VTEPWTPFPQPSLFALCLLAEQNIAHLFVLADTLRGAGVARRRPWVGVLHEWKIVLDHMHATCANAVVDPRAKQLLMQMLTAGTLEVAENLNSDRRDPRFWRSY